MAKTGKMWWNHDNICFVLDKHIALDDSVCTDLLSASRCGRWAYSLE